LQSGIAMDRVADVILPCAWQRAASESHQPDAQSGFEA